MSTARQTIAALTLGTVVLLANADNAGAAIALVKNVATGTVIVVVVLVVILVGAPGTDADVEVNNQAVVAGLVGSGGSRSMRGRKGLASIILARRLQRNPGDSPPNLSSPNQHQYL